MTKPLVIINVVGLTYEHLGPHTPHLMALAKSGIAAPARGVFPAVTCTAQASMLTGTTASQHGIVANGWYFRDTSEVRLWLQSNHLIQGTKLYERFAAPDSSLTNSDSALATAKMFWWYNMYAPVAFSMTPRPSYPADGRKIFDSYSFPASLRDELQAKLGVFPLPAFWGPMAGIESSRWIASASIEVMRKHRPALTLVYLPHLDYDLQRLGPGDPQINSALREVDAEAGRVIEAARTLGAEILVVSEYGITAVNQPVHINRVLREVGLLTVRREPLGYETLDCGASRAFAVSDHQVAHVYVRDPADLSRVKQLLEQTPGIDRVLDEPGKVELGVAHERAGELVAIAAPDAWFTYYFWLDDKVAPDYARTIDIHRKPGYDPTELFFDPNLRFPKLRVIRRLIRKKLGFRYYMDVIGLDARIVKGSHGRLATPGREISEGPVIIASRPDLPAESWGLTDVPDLALRLMNR
ncbi:MAG: alkaline phosphatase family protein [Planctomyces sp.]|nr:alkaline phosphatase family protein [Planctomyces sp.]